MLAPATTSRQDAPDCSWENKVVSGAKRFTGVWCTVLFFLSCSTLVCLCLTCMFPFLEAHMASSTRMTHTHGMLHFLCLQQEVLIAGSTHIKLHTWQGEHTHHAPMASCISSACSRKSSLLPVSACMHAHVQGRLGDSVVFTGNSMMYG